MASEIEGVMARPASGQSLERKSTQGVTFAARFSAYSQRQYLTLGHSWDGYTRRRAETEVEYGHLESNPARGRRRRLKADRPRRTWLEPEQIKPLLDATVRGLRGGKTVPDVRTRVLFATAICAGLRVGELLQLRWADVDLAQGRIRVAESKTPAGRDRDVHIWPELREELAVYKATTRHAEPEDYVFGTSTGKPDTRTNIAKRLSRAVTRANQLREGDDQAPIPPNLSPHSLRRTFAS